MAGKIEWEPDLNITMSMKTGKKFKLNRKAPKLSLPDLHKLTDTFDVVEIQLNPKTHEELRADLAETSGQDVHTVTKLFGIPVIVRKGVPGNALLLVRLKKKGTTS